MNSKIRFSSVPLALAMLSASSLGLAAGSRTRFDDNTLGANYIGDDNSVDGGGVSGEAQGDASAEQQQDQANTGVPQAGAVKADASETAAGEANAVGDPQAGDTNQAQ